MIESGDIVSWAGRSGHYSVVGTHEGIATVKKIGEMVNKPSYNANVGELTVVQKHRSSYRYPLTSSILRKAILAGAITPEQAKSESIIEAAENIAYEHKDDEEVGSSDMTFILKEFLDEIGVETHWENNRLSIKKPTKMEINFNSFTLDQFESFVKSEGGQDIDVTISEGNNIKDKAKTFSRLPRNKFDKSVFSIGDIGKEINIYKGSENIYADFVVYDQDNSPFTISLFSKENHKGLKEITEEIVEKFARGGGVKSKKIDYNKLAESNVWGLEADDIRRIEEEGEYDSPGHYKFNRVRKSENSKEHEYEAVYDGLYMHVFGSLEDLMARKKEIAYYEYRDSDPEETFVDADGNERDTGPIEGTKAAHGRSLAAINKDRKYFNKNEEHERRYAEKTGRSTISYNKNIFDFLAANGKNVTANTKMPGTEFFVSNTIKSIEGGKEVRYDLSVSYNKDFNSVVIKETDYKVPTSPYTRSLYLPLEGASTLYSMLDKLMHHHIYGKASNGATVTSVWNITYFDKDGEVIDQTQIDEKNEELAWELFAEFGHTKEPGMYIEWEEENDPDEIAQAKNFKKGGFVGKGELVWGKLSKSKRGEFLQQNFTPEITPRSQELMTGRDFKFLPKKVKTVLESKYANVEEYSSGGGVTKQAKPYPLMHIGKINPDKNETIFTRWHPPISVYQAANKVWAKADRAKREELLMKYVYDFRNYEKEKMPTPGNPKGIGTAVPDMPWRNLAWHWQRDIATGLHNEHFGGGYSFKTVENGGTASNGAKISKQEEDDYYHLLDVEQRLVDGEVEIDGKALSPEEAKEYMFKHMSKIIKLGRKGWNPFDTIYIIEGDTDETDDPEAAEKDAKTIKAANGAGIDGGETTTMRTEVGTVDVYSLLAFPLEEDVVVYYAEKSDKKGKSSVFWIVNKEDADMLEKVGYTITKVNVAKGNRPYSLTTGEIGTKMAAKGRSLAAINKDRKYFNKSEDHEVRYAEKTGRDTKSYNKSPKHLVIKNVDNEMFVETEKDGEVTYTSDLKKATTFTIGDEDSEADAHSTLALLNETYEDGFSLIEVAADGAEIDEMVNDWKAVKKVLGTKAEGHPRDMKVLDIESNTVHTPILIDYDQETVMMESEEFGRAGNSLDKVIFFFDDEAPALKKEKPSVLSPAELMRQKTSTISQPTKTIPTTTTTTPATQSSFSKPLKTNIPYQPGKYNEALKKVWQEAKGSGVVIKSDEFMEKIEEAIMLELSELVYKDMLQEAVDYLLENQIVLKSKPFMKNIQVVLQN